MKTPTISLITPVKNGERFLQSALNSVRQQTGEFRLEYVIIDGQSDDKTNDIIKANLDLFSAHYSEPDTGMYDAISKGFERTSGDIMGWINADDVYFPWTMATVTRIFSQLPEVEWLSTINPVTINQYGEIESIRRIGGFSRQAFIDGIYVGFDGLGNPYASDFIQQESTFWRRNLWERLGPDPLSYYRAEPRQAGDFGLWAMFAETAELYGVTPPLCSWRMHDSQWTEPSSYMIEVRRSLDLLQKAVSYKGLKPPPSDFLEYTGKYLITDSVTNWKTVERPFFVMPRSDLKTGIGSGYIF